MKPTDIFNTLEKKMELINNGVTFKGSYRVIKEKDYQEIKRQFTIHNVIDDDYLWENGLEEVK